MITAMGALVAVLVLLVSPPGEPSTTGCTLVFEPDNGTGRSVGEASRDDCFEFYVEREARRFGQEADLGAIESGLVTYNSERGALYDPRAREWRYRWRVEFEEEFDAPPSVATRIRRVEANEPREPRRITKCDLRPNGFELIVSWGEAFELHALEVEWVAYEVDPPVTPPQSCEEGWLAREQG